jgi:dolichol-phosphate mannosyltransferase
MTATAPLQAARLEVVSDYAAADRAVRAGGDSERLVVLEGQAEGAAREAAAAGVAAGRGPLRSRPYSCGKRCLVVIPTYNEKDNVAAIARDARAYLDADVLIVDDASPDGTGALADALAAADPRVHVLHRGGKQGLGTAYLAGFAYAAEHGFEKVFEMDADFSHPPWDLPRLAWAGLGSDLAIGSRYVPGGSTVGWDAKRRLLSRGANLYARLLLGTGIRDMTAGFRCFDVAKLRELDLARVSAQGYAFQIEMAFRMVRAGGRVVEVPIHFVDRRVGASKMDGKVAREALLLVPRLRFRR